MGMFRDRLVEHSPSFPLIIAHRGASFLAPENTIAAFDLAAEQGAKAFELDIQRTQDNFLAVFHDISLMRTTRTRGRITQKTKQEIQQLDAGYWKSEKFKNERIPFLGDVLSRYTPTYYINIELKEESVSLENDALEQQVIETIHRYRCEEQVLISSFSYKAIQTIKRLNPRILTGLLYNRKLLGKEDVVRLVEKFQADFFHCSIREATEKRLKELNKAHIPVLVYTVNDAQIAHKLWKHGVSGFFTDVPDILLRAFQ
jgi:glycerophosphoryl diester phosphodiesterase